MNIIIFDTETTGLLKPEINMLAAQPYITEIHCKKVNENLEVLDVFDSLVKPPISIPEELQRKIGITDTMVASAPTFSELYSRLATFFLDVPICIGHNVAFDIGMLHNELARIEKVLHFPWPIRHVCTVEKSKYIEQRRINLTTLHTYATGVPFDGAHRASADVSALLSCCIWLNQNDKLF